MIIMHRSILLLAVFFALILVTSAGKKHDLLPTNGDEMVQHPLMPNVLIRKRYIRSFLKKAGSNDILKGCSGACLPTCVCCYA